MDKQERPDSTGMGSLSELRSAQANTHQAKRGARGRKWVFKEERSLTGRWDESLPVTVPV